MATDFCPAWTSFGKQNDLRPFLERIQGKSWESDVLELHLPESLNSAWLGPGQLGSVGQNLLPPPASDPELIPSTLGQHFLTPSKCFATHLQQTSKGSTQMVISLGNPRLSISSWLSAHTCSSTGSLGWHLFILIHLGEEGKIRAPAGSHTSSSPPHKCRCMYTHCSSHLSSPELTGCLWPRFSPQACEVGLRPREWKEVHGSVGF